MAEVYRASQAGRARNTTALNAAIQRAYTVLTSGRFMPTCRSHCPPPLGGWQKFRPYNWKNENEAYKKELCRIFFLYDFMFRILCPFIFAPKLGSRESA
jgi:hypothetical protein